MVTGSHIPDDRNGIKFNLPWGEVLKEDEVQITDLYLRQKESVVTAEFPFNQDGFFNPRVEPSLGAETDVALSLYRDRYVRSFPSSGLKGHRIVIYQHSSVSREVLPEILERLGAEVEVVGWSDTFVPVDTEAVEDVRRLAAWVNEFNADALVSTDGDGDRPLVVDNLGRVIRGDVLGTLAARFLGADSVSVPVSCSSVLEDSGFFSDVHRTRIGSPWVIPSMEAAKAAGSLCAVGFEANGGFLLGSDCQVEAGGGILKALPTRDAILPITAVLLSVTGSGRTLSEMVAELPDIHNYSGLLKKFPSETGHAVVTLVQDGGLDLVRELFSPEFGDPVTIDFTDGARITFSSGEIVHLRPSGNAPEFRCYTESSSEARAKAASEIALKIVKESLSSLVNRT